jgi:hypothetical protein
VDLFCRHGLRFDDDSGGFLASKAADEVAGFGRVVGPNDFAAAGEDVLFELLQVVVEMIESVLLDLVGVLAELLVFGQERVGASACEPAGRGIDGELEFGIAERGGDLS